METTEAAELAEADHEERPDLKSEAAAIEQELLELQADEPLVHARVDARQVAEVIADWTGIPVNRMTTDELEKITHLPAYLQEHIKGQDTAIDCLHQHLLTARADLRRPGRPMGAFLLVGPSGVGKTETVVQLAELLYGGRQFLTTINMSEYQEKHTVSRLIGSPPGYVGFGEGGILTEAIRQKPYSVVLLDEVEKAHPEVLNLFYQAFDKGELADGEGRLIDCKNVVFFLTSNLGYQTIVNHAESRPVWKRPYTRNWPTSSSPLCWQGWKWCLIYPWARKPSTVSLATNSSAWRTRSRPVTTPTWNFRTA